MGRRLMPLLVLTFFISASVSAAEFKTAGKTYEGEVLDESRTEFIVETKDGIINIPKSKIVTLDGEPYTGAPPAAPKAKMISSTGNSQYAVQVGSEGLTRQELSVYQSGRNKLERHQYLSEMDWGTNDINIRAAIEDEIAFQEALKAGVHQTDPVRGQIIENYRAGQTLNDIQPALFGDEEMRAFYESHKSEFMFPAEYAFKVLQVPPSGAGKATAQKAKTSPDSVQGWKTAKVKEGDTFHLPLSTSQQEKIFAMRRNQVSDLISDGMGMGYVFWCTAYKAPEQKKFEQARERVKHLMIKSKQSANNAQLEQRVQSQAPGQTSEAALFDEAVRAGVHRQRHIRSFVINLYLEQRGVKLGAIANEAKDRYEITLNV